MQTVAANVYSRRTVIQTGDALGAQEKVVVLRVDLEVVVEAAHLEFDFQIYLPLRRG